jgi:hypothetical protein
MRNLLLFVFIGVVFAQAPHYQTYYCQECAGIAIDVNYYAAPCVADWDGDGIKDLIVGNWEATATPSDGYVLFFANENTNDNPVFNSYSLLEADGEVIAVFAS